MTLKKKPKRMKAKRLLKMKVKNLQRMIVKKLPKMKANKIQKIILKMMKWNQKKLSLGLQLLKL